MRLLVTGGTGLVGSNVIKLALEKYGAPVVASAFRLSPAGQWGVPTVRMDLEDNASIRRAVAEVRPDAVIHCAAPRDEDRLEVDHKWGWQVMVTGTEVMARACQEVGARLVFVSSDWVFGNRGQPPYSEDSPLCPFNYFGFLKAIGEMPVRALCENSAVVRIAAVYGPNWALQSFEQAEEGIGFGWVPNHYVYRLSRRLPVVVWTRYYSQCANPSLASDIADALLTVAGSDVRGTLHCCGREGVPRLELARAVADAFGYDERLVRAAAEAEMGLDQLAGKLPAPPDTRLSVAQTQARLGRVALGVRDGLAEYRRQVEEIRTHGWEGTRLYRAAQRS